MEQTQQTIRNKAAISITVKYGNDYFKIETELTNETGVSEVEINNERMQIQDLVTAGIEDYKQVKEHLSESIENRSNKIADIKQMIEVKKQQKEDPAIIEQIKKMPEYKPKNS